MRNKLEQKYLFEFSAVNGAQDEDKSSVTYAYP